MQVDSVPDMAAWLWIEKDMHHSLGKMTHTVIIVTMLSVHGKGEGGGCVCVCMYYVRVTKQ